MFFCMGCHGPPIEYKLYIYIRIYIYIYIEYCFCYIYNIYSIQYIYIYISIFIFFDYDIQLLENWKISLRHIGTLYSMFNLATQTASRRNRLMSAKEREK